MAGGAFRPIGAIAAALVVVAMWASAARADAFDVLDKSFVDAYRVAADDNLKRLQREVPIVVNLFDRVVLYPPGAEPLAFTMDPSQYMEATGASHAAAALYVRIVPYGFGYLAESQLDWLRSFTPAVNDALSELETRNDIPPALKQSQRTMLVNVKSLAERLMRNRRATNEDFADFGAGVVQGIRDSLDFAAQAQLTQFRRQIEVWEKENPQLAWDKAVVVVIAGHQPRTDYLQRQFFDWAYPDTVSHEDRVVFAETQRPPAQLDDLTVVPYLTLLSKVMLDKDFAQTIFGDRYALQSDVLGRSAAAIIKSWPQRPGR